MSNEEIKEEIKEEKECGCGCPFCKIVKKVLLISASTFIGFYCAMSLFFAIHKPPMPPCPNFNRPPMEMNFEHHKFRGEHHQFKGEKPNFNQEQPQKPEQK